MDKRIITASKAQCQHRGLDPYAIPTYTEHFSPEELKVQLHEYKEVLDVIRFFTKKFLSSLSDEPYFVAISDSEGYVLAFEGNESIIEKVRELGVVEGARFSEEVGTNAVDLCLRSMQPVQLIGEDHYHKVLHGIACYTAPIFRKNGEMIGTLSLMTVVEFAHPHLLALLITIVDSIERELLLRKHNTQLQILNQMLLETNYYGVIITDAVGTIVEINDNCAAILGQNKHGKDSCLGKSVFDTSAIGTYFEKAISHGESCVGAELVMMFNEAIHYYMLDVVRIYDTEHNLIRVVGSLRDITEMKKTEELLRNSEKLVCTGQIAVSIAQEIRNPMTTVKGLLQLSSKMIEPLHYNLIMSELERMNAIVSEFLILGRPQADTFKEESFHSIFLEVLNVFETQAIMNGITVNSRLGEDCSIFCDRNHIKQVFLNILKNALEALPYGGEIDIHSEMAEGYQRIRISDNGLGMTADVLRRISEPFHSTRPDANGLGMMIVDKIIAAHNGRIAITSEVDVGTMVDIYLPTA
ncbi:PAS domain S-box-containing protein [Paenibacillus castaneae]|uniref:ATP-binding protein n=1 Tax=Paenibacillus castaneae TaxID=474957 RepID=UPI000C9A42DF|nr:ATP-binding protein [Paenibacillus castaneae]NIK78245.1 PAS domain S-box-containing protein [Paenibacillus castaneae]